MAYSATSSDKLHLQLGSVGVGGLITYSEYGAYSGSLRINSTLTARDTASFTIPSADGSFIPVVGQPVLISHDDLGDLFGGSIDQVHAVNAPGSALVTSECLCVSWDLLLYKRQTGVRSYQDQAAGDIIGDLITASMGGEGLTSVTVTGPNVTIAFEYELVGNAFDAICQACSDGTDTYVWWTTPDKVVHFAKQTTTAAPWNTDDDLLIQLSATWTREKYANRVYARLGKYILDAVTESYPGDGAARTFAIINPVASVPVVKVNTVTKTVGVLNVDTGKDWYWQQNSNIITQDSGGTILTSGDTLEVTYQGFTTLTVLHQVDVAVDERSGVEGGTGYYESVVDVSTPTTSQQADAVAASIAEKFAVIPLKLEAKTHRGALQAGQAFGPIDITEFGITGATFLIDSVTMDTTPDNFVVWTLTAVGASGPLIGDWRTAFINLTQQGSVGSSSGNPSTSNADATVIDVTNADIALSAIRQVVNVLATTRDCTVTIPLSINMGGVPVVVKRAIGSTYDVIVTHSGSDTIEGSSSPINMSGDGESRTFVGDGSTNWVQTAASGTTTVTATPPLLPSSCSAADTPANRYIDRANQLTSTPITVTVVLPASHQATWVIVEATNYAGSGWDWIGKFPVTSAAGSQALAPFWRIVPALGATWQVRVTTGSSNGENDPSTFVVSAGFAVTGLSAPPDFAVEGLTITGPAYAGINGIGDPFWRLSMTGSWPTTLNPNTWTFQVVVAGCDAAGNLDPGPSANGKTDPWFDFANGEDVYETLDGNYNAPGSGYEYLKIWVLAISRAMDSWRDAGAVLQKWPDTSTYKIVHFGPRPNTLDLTATNIATLSKTLTKTSDGRLASSLQNPENVIPNPDFEEDSLGVGVPAKWTASGTATISIVTPGDASTKCVTISGSADGAIISWDYSNKFVVHPGELWYQSIRAKSPGADGALYWLMRFHKANNDYITDYSTLVPAGTTNWTTFGTNFATPADAAYAVMFVYTTGRTTGTYYIDHVSLKSQTSTGDGMQADGAGGVKWKPTGALSVDGSGNAVVTPLGVTTALLDAFAVTQAKLANAQIIDAARIVDAAVLEAKINTGAVTVTKIGALAVTTAKIDNLAVTNAKIDNLAVTGAKIDNATITTAKIANAAITTALIANAAIVNALIGNAEITGAKIASATITGANIANATITDALIANATITSAKIVSLDVSKLNAGTITVSSTSGTGVTVKYSGDSSQLQLYAGATVLINASGGYAAYMLNTTSYGGLVSVFDASATERVRLQAWNTSPFVGSYGVYIDNLRVLGPRQTGPGNPSFATLGDAQTWCQNLLTALRNSGPIT